MRAAIFRQLNAPVTIEVVPDVSPGPGEVVIKVARCGICGSDPHMISNPIMGLPAGTAMGHEFAGEVVELGRGSRRFKVGDRISAMPTSGCGTCVACASGHPYACPQIRLMMGGFGEYAVTCEAYATPLPDHLTMADGALVEPLSAALRGVSSAALERGANILVLGAGSMGLGTVFWARRLGAGKIAATARSAWREPLALTMGADALLVGEDRLAERVIDFFGGSPDVVFECVGSPGMIPLAVNLVRPRGTVVVEGGCMQADAFVPFIAMCKELRMQFSAAYTRRDFDAVVATMARGQIEPRVMVTQTLPLDAVPGALASTRANTRQCKVMIDPWLESPMRAGA